MTSLGLPKPETGEHLRPRLAARPPIPCPEPREVDRQFRFEGSTLVSYLSLTNVYGQDNVGMYAWSPGSEQVKPMLDLGFLPVLGFEYKF